MSPLTLPRFALRKSNFVSILPLLLVALLGTTACKQGGTSTQSKISFQKEIAELNKEENQTSPSQPIEKADENGTPKATDKQTILYSQAKSAYLTNDLESAERFFKELAATDPLSTEKQSGIIALAQIFLSSQRPKDAIKVLNDLIEQLPDLPEPHYILGRAYAADHQIDPAIAQYEKLLVLQPDYLMAMVELAALYNMNGEKEKTAETLRKYEQDIYHYAKILEADNSAIEDKKYVLSIFAMVTDERATKAVVHALNDPFPEIRLEAVTQLGDDDPDPAIMKRIEEMSQTDPFIEIRLAAKASLSQLRSKPALPKKSPKGP